MTATSLPVHEFSVRTAGVSVLDDSVFDALFEAGCDDALVGTDPDGDYLDFGRAAPTLKEAVASARAAIESVPGPTGAPSRAVRRATPALSNCVGHRRFCRSRQHPACAGVVLVPPK